MDDFKDIKAKWDVGIIEQAKPGERTARNEFLLVARDGFSRRPEGEAAPGFDFDEDEGVAGLVPADDIDFPAVGCAEVAVENPIALATEITRGQAFPFPAEAMAGVAFLLSGGPGEPGEKSGDESGKAHARGA